MRAQKSARESMLKGGEKKMLALIPCVGPVFAIILAPLLIGGSVSLGVPSTVLTPWSALIWPLAAAIIF